MGHAQNTLVWGEWVGEVFLRRRPLIDRQAEKGFPEVGSRCAGTELEEEERVYGKRRAVQLVQLRLGSLSAEGHRKHVGVFPSAAESLTGSERICRIIAALKQQQQNEKHKNTSCCCGGQTGDYLSWVLRGGWGRQGATANQGDGQEKEPCLSGKIQAEKRKEEA